MSPAFAVEGKPERGEERAARKLGEGVRGGPRAMEDEEAPGEEGGSRLSLRVLCVSREEGESPGGVVEEGKSVAGSAELPLWRKRAIDCGVGMLICGELVDCGGGVGADGVTDS